MRFSVITPVYKAEKYLRNCIESILKQTFTDFELILVNDGSPDNCGLICDEYALKDNRVKVLHQSNMGVSIARNNAIDVSNGEYLVFVDADDLVRNNLLEELDLCISNNGCDVVIYGYDIERKTKKEQVIFLEGYDTEEIKEILVGDYWDNMPWNKCIKRNLFKGYKFEEGICYEDYFLLPSLIFNAKKINIIQKSLYIYNCVNEHSITKKQDSLHRWFKWNAKKHNEYFAKLNSLKCLRICEKNTIAEARRCMFEHYFDNKLGEERIREIKFYLENKNHIRGKDRFWIDRILNDDIFVCKLYAILKGYHRC